MPSASRISWIAAETSSSSRAIRRGAHLDDRHLAAEAPEHLPELEADVAAADDDEVAREEVHVHHRAVGEEWHLIDARHGRHAARPPTLMKMRSAVEPFGADADLVRALEPGVALIHRAALVAAQTLFDAGTRRARDRVLARLDALHVHRHRADAHAELGAAAGECGGICAGHHRLRRNAAGVDARPAEVMAFDDAQPTVPKLPIWTPQTGPPGPCQSQSRRISPPSFRASAGQWYVRGSLSGLGTGLGTRGSGLGTRGSGLGARGSGLGLGARGSGTRGSGLGARGSLLLKHLA